MSAPSISAAAAAFVSAPAAREAIAAERRALRLAAEAAARAARR